MAIDRIKERYINEMNAMTEAIKLGSELRRMDEGIPAAEKQIAWDNGIANIPSLLKQAKWDSMSRGATLTIAASNATAKSKAAADYVCTGENDEVIINAAIESLDGIGGCVELSEGTFNLRAGETYDVLLNVDNVWLKGQGKASVLSGEYSNIIISAAGVKVSDLRYMGGIFVHDGGDAIVDSCYIRSFEIVIGGKATMINSNIDDHITNFGELIINSSTTPELASVPSIIPSTVELLKEINNIQSVTFEEV